MPRIYLPLEKVERCHVCDGVGKLRLCSQCAERAYCSVECQKRDWKGHKSICRTDRIDLTSYYPVLACIAELCHTRVIDMHPALVHKVINSPNPEAPAGLLPDGSSARIVKLGNPVNQLDWKPDVTHWWPTGHTPNVRSKLMRRIAREGNVLPTVTSTCLAIMLAMYSTTTTGETAEPHRLRLRYRSSPVSDFGIVAGSARVTPEDQLAYKLPDKSILKGQDPQDHYWIYFRTHKGEEVLLECNMFTFNMCLVVPTSLYFDESSGFPMAVPAWFQDRAATRQLVHQPALLRERRRFSVLRDESLLKALQLESVDLESNRDISVSEDTVKTFVAFMTKVAGRPVTDTERDVCITGFAVGANMIVDTAQTGKWKGFPAQPNVAIENDPGEVLD